VVGEARPRRPARCSALPAGRGIEIEIDVIGNDTSAPLDLAALEGGIGPRTNVIAITHVPAQGGLINLAANSGLASPQCVIFHSPGRSGSGRRRDRRFGKQSRRLLCGVM